MPSDLVKFSTHFFDPFNFDEYLLNKSIDEFEEEYNDSIVREDIILYIYAMLLTLNEANYHYKKHELKEILEPDEKKMREFINQAVEEYENVRKELGENQSVIREYKESIDFLVNNNAHQLMEKIIL